MKKQLTTGPAWQHKIFYMKPSMLHLLIQGYVNARFHLIYKK